MHCLAVWGKLLSSMVTMLAFNTGVCSLTPGCRHIIFQLIFVHQDRILDTWAQKWIKCFNSFPVQGWLVNVCSLLMVDARRRCRRQILLHFSSRLVSLYTADDELSDLYQVGVIHTWPHIAMHTKRQKIYRIVYYYKCKTKSIQNIKIEDNFFSANTHDCICSKYSTDWSWLNRKKIDKQNLRR